MHKNIMMLSAVMLLTLTSCDKYKSHNDVDTEDSYKQLALATKSSMEDIEKNTNFVATENETVAPMIPAGSASRNSLQFAA